MQKKKQYSHYEKLITFRDKAYILGFREEYKFLDNPTEEEELLNTCTEIEKEAETIIKIMKSKISEILEFQNKNQMN